MRKIIIATLLLLSFINVYPNQNNETEIIGNQNQYEKLINLAKTYFHKNTEYAFNCAYKAYRIAEENHDHTKAAECNTIMGDIFKENNSFPTAISYYEEAIENLTTTKDYHTIYKLYIKIAKLYQNGEFDSKWSIEAMDNALKYAQLINETETYNEIYLALGEIYCSQDNCVLAEDYFNKILKNDINKSTILPISVAMTNKAKMFIKQKKYEDAISLIDSSLYLCIREFNDSLQAINYDYKAQIFDSLSDFESARKYYRQSAMLAYEIEDYHNCGKSMFSLAHLYQRHGKHDKAINVFKIINDSTIKYRMYDICYQSCYQLSKCHASLEQYEKAYEYFIYYDSAFTTNHEKKIEELRNSYLLSLNANELKAKEIEEKNIRDNINDWKLFISIIIVLIMISITFIILYSTNKATSHKNEVTTYEQQHKIDKIENDLMEYQLKNNRELTMKLAFQLKSYLQIINPIKEDLKNAIELPENEQKNKIKNIYQHLQNNIHIFNNAENLNKQIDKVYKEFLNRLEEKYPGLTKAEKKLCTLLYINMSSKEIATITNSTIRTVETSRYRLRKKFNLSRDEDIVSFLQKI